MTVKKLKRQNEIHLHVNGSVYFLVRISLSECADCFFHIPFSRCLIPVFALGRAQELLLILDEYWAMHPELQDVPIYYASSLAKKCMSVYQTYINAMNDKIKRQINVSNPFVFKHISNLKVLHVKG